ncbi:hypothetical protein HZB89_00695, partial [archaeon]|nr:hypothetical protein [archaeon]
NFYEDAIPAKQSLVLPLKIALTGQAKEILVQQQFNGTLFIKASNSAYGIDKNFAIPIEVNINLPGEVANQACLELAMSEWIESTLPGKEISASFELKNNCVVEDEETGETSKVELENLSISGLPPALGITTGILLENNGESYELGDVSSGAILMQKMPAGSKWAGTISFKAEEIYGSKPFEAGISFKADYRKALNSVQEVKSNSNGIAIQVIDLKECMAVDPDSLELEADNSEQELTIQNNGCGMNARVRACFKDNETLECSNEANDELKATLSGSLTGNGALLNNNDSKAFKVKRNYTKTGAYLLRLEASPSNENDWTEVARVEIEDKKLSTENFSLTEYLLSAFKGVGGETTFLNEGFVGRNGNGLLTGTINAGGECLEPCQFNPFSTFGNASGWKHTDSTTGQLVAGCTGTEGKCNKYSESSIDALNSQLAALKEPELLALSLAEGTSQIEVQIPASDLSGDRHYRIAVKFFNGKDNKDKHPKITVTCPDGYGIFDESNYKIIENKKEDCDVGPTYAISQGNTSLTAEYGCSGTDHSSWSIGKSDDYWSLGVSLIAYCEEFSFHNSAPSRQVRIPVVVENNALQSDYQSFKDIKFSSGTKTEAKHAGFITKEDFEEALPSENVSYCKLGGKTGVSGIGAKPKVKYNWNWPAAAEGGIKWNECDAGNPEGIYCDMAQFTLSHLQKIMALNNFFKKNDSLLACPAGIYSDWTSNKNLLETAFGGEAESAGISRIDYKFTPSSESAAGSSKLEFKITAGNYFTQTYDESIEIEVQALLVHPTLQTGYYSGTSCDSVKTSKALGKGEEEILSCSFDGVAESDDYSVYIKVINPVESLAGTGEEFYDEESLNGMTFAG